MNTELPRIIVGVAEREDSAAAVRYAVGESRRRHLPVHLVHAVHPLLAGPDSDLIAVTREPVLMRAHQVLEDVAADVRAELGADAPVTTELVVGHAAATLAQMSEGAALVVLQPERMGQQQHVPTYSITSHVAVKSHPPVVAVPADWSEPDPGLVTVGVRDAEGSAPLLTTALEEAASRGVPLRVVHAWHYGPYDDVVFAGADEQRHSDELAEQVRAELAPLAAKFSDTPVELVVHHARPADALVAESGRTSLLVVGRHRVGRRVSKHLGSVGRAVLRASSCPVLVADPIG